jgi:putative ABC transport system permease protein
MLAKRIVDDYLYDLRLSLRSLIKTPVFTAVAILTLALGIGANVSIFSLIESILLRPLPYDQPEQLIMMSEGGDDISNRMISYPNFLDWREGNQAFAFISTMRDVDLALTEGGSLEVVTARVVAADYFGGVMRIPPILGRDFTSDDEKSRSPVVEISNRFWRRHFGADPQVLGKTISLNRSTFTVIGVVPDVSFSDAAPPLWLLVGGRWGDFNWGRDHREDRTAGYVIGRLKPSVTTDQARQNMASVCGELFKQYPVHNAGGPRPNLLSLKDSLVGDLRPALLILFGAVGLVFLIACANVANLLLARGLSRQKEVAIRAALGAGRRHILRQVLAESLLLAVAGGSAGLLLADSILLIYRSWGRQVGPMQHGPAINLYVIAFTTAISLLAGLSFGLLSAWHASKGDLNILMREGGRTASGRGAFRNVIVVSEMALALVLFIGAGLLIKSLERLIESDPGFNPKHLVTMDLNLPYGRYEKKDERSRLFRQVAEGVGSLPGVESVSISSSHPGFPDRLQNDIFPEDHPPLQRGELINVDWAPVSEDYFKATQIQIEKGRSFTREEVDQGLPVVVVDANLAARFWPGQEALGKWIKYDSPTKHEIVGIARPVQRYGSELQPLIKIYTPLGRATVLQAALSIRGSATDLRGLATAINDRIHSLDSDIAASRVETMEALLAAVAAPMRFNTILLGLFAAIAGGLAVSGLYGVIAYIVSERTREIGIRMAIGASRRDVVALILGNGLRLTLIGIAVGAAASVAVTRLMKNLLFGVSTSDPMVFIGMCLILVFVAMMASVVPTLKATRIDPAVALRCQ